MSKDQVLTSIVLTRAQRDWLERVARANGNMSMAAAIRRLIDNAMRREKRDDCEREAMRARAWGLRKDMLGEE